MRRQLVALFTAVGVIGAGSIALAADSTYNAHLDGAAERPVPRETRARGNAVFHLSDDGTELEYKLIVANIENVFAAHIHAGDEGTAGPIVAGLYEAPVAGGRIQGPIATGTITAADLTGPLAGQPLSALVELIESGEAYVNVHTNDGVAPVNTGPGDFPAGEIRGQME
jgi:hypothetical protein